MASIKTESTDGCLFRKKEDGSMEKVCNLGSFSFSAEVNTDLFEKNFEPEIDPGIIWRNIQELPWEE